MIITSIIWVWSIEKCLEVAAMKKIIKMMKLKWNNVIKKKEIILLGRLKLRLKGHNVPEVITICTNYWCMMKNFKKVGAYAQLSMNLNLYNLSNNKFNDNNNSLKKWLCQLHRPPCSLNNNLVSRSTSIQYFPNNNSKLGLIGVYTESLLPTSST